MSKRTKKNRRKKAAIEKPSMYVSSFTITQEPLENKYTKMTPNEVREKVEDFQAMLVRKPKDLIPLLLDCMEKYPNVPLLYNYLTVAYGRIGDREKAESTALENLTKHPDYLFAKLSYAEICLANGEASKVPSIFNNKLDLKLLYPKRSKFHVSEFTGFATIVCKYYNAIGEREKAVTLYKSLSTIAPEDLTTKELKRHLYPSLFRRLLTKFLAMIPDEPASSSRQ
jgi:tetratricopeptide (TPR) repeat protein